MSGTGGTIIQTVLVAPIARAFQYSVLLPTGNFPDTVTDNAMLSEAYRYLCNEIIGLKSANKWPADIPKTHMSMKIESLIATLDGDRYGGWNTTIGGPDWPERRKIRVDATVLFSKPPETPRRNQTW